LRHPRTFVLLALALVVATRLAVAETKSVEIFEGREISVEVPEGWQSMHARDATTGVQTLSFEDPRGEIKLDISFIPDSEGRLATRAGLEAQMRSAFSDYKAGAVEREMKFTFVEVVGGLCGYTSFTDRSLVGKKPPAGERLISTTGIRSWKGAYMIFTLLTNSVDSKPYRDALTIVTKDLRESRGRTSSF
jgi:hypothetical protein